MIRQAITSVPSGGPIVASTYTERLSSWGRKAAAVGAGGALGLLVAVAIVVALLYTSWGLARTADKIEQRVSGEIPGRLQIGALGDLQLFSPVGTVTATARDVVFTGPPGREVVRLQEVEIDFRPGALWTNELHFSRVEVDGGTVTVAPGARGKTELENAFDTPSGSTKPRPLAFDLRAIQVRDMTLDIPLESRRFTLTDIHGVMGIFETRWAEGVTVEFNGLAGQMRRPKMLGADATVRQIDGKVRGNRDRVVDLEFIAELFGGHVDGRFRYYPKQDPKVRLTLDPKGEIVALVSFVANLRSELGGGVTIELK